MQILNRLGEWTATVRMISGYDMVVYPTTWSISDVIDELLGEDAKDWLDKEDIEVITLDFDDDFADYVAPW